MKHSLFFSLSLALLLSLSSIGLYAEPGSTGATTNLSDITNKRMLTPPSIINITKRGTIHIQKEPPRMEVQVPFNLPPSKNTENTEPTVKKPQSSTVYFNDIINESSPQKSIFSNNTVPLVK